MSLLFEEIETYTHVEDIDSQRDINVLLQDMQSDMTTLSVMEKEMPTNVMSELVEANLIEVNDEFITEEGIKDFAKMIQQNVQKWIGQFMSFIKKWYAKFILLVSNLDKERQTALAFWKLNIHETSNKVFIKAPPMDLQDKNFRAGYTFIEGSNHINYLKDNLSNITTSFQGKDINLTHNKMFEASNIGRGTWSIFMNGTVDKPMGESAYGEAHAKKELSPFFDVNSDNEITLDESTLDDKEIYKQLCFTKDKVRNGIDNVYDVYLSRVTELGKLVEDASKENVALYRDALLKAIKYYGKETNAMVNKYRDAITLAFYIKSNVRITEVEIKIEEPLNGNRPEATNVKDKPVEDMSEEEKEIFYANETKTQREEREKKETLTDTSLSRRLYNLLQDKFTGSEDVEYDTVKSILETNIERIKEEGKINNDDLIYRLWERLLLHYNAPANNSLTLHIGKLTSFTIGVLLYKGNMFIKASKYMDVIELFSNELKVVEEPTLIFFDKQPDLTSIALAKQFSPLLSNSNDVKAILSILNDLKSIAPSDVTNRTKVFELFNGAIGKCINDIKGSKPKIIAEYMLKHNTNLLREEDVELLQNVLNDESIKVDKEIRGKEIIEKDLIRKVTTSYVKWYVNASDEGELNEKIHEWYKNNKTKIERVLTWLERDYLCNIIRIPPASVCMAVLYKYNNTTVKKEINNTLRGVFLDLALTTETFKKSTYKNMYEYILENVGADNYSKAVQQFVTTGEYTIETDTVSDEDIAEVVKDLDDVERVIYDGLTPKEQNFFILNNTSVEISDASRIRGAMNRHASELLGDDIQSTISLTNIYKTMINMAMQGVKHSFNYIIAELIVHSAYAKQSVVYPITNKLEKQYLANLDFIFTVFKAGHSTMSIPDLTYLIKETCSKVKKITLSSLLEEMVKNPLFDSSKVPTTAPTLCNPTYNHTLHSFNVRGELDLKKENNKAYAQEYNKIILKAFEISKDVKLIIESGTLPTKYEKVISSYITLAGKWNDTWDKLNLPLLAQAIDEVKIVDIGDVTFSHMSGVVSTEYIKRIGAIEIVPNIKTTTHQLKLALAIFRVCALSIKNADVPEEAMNAYPNIVEYVARKHLNSKTDVAKGVGILKRIKSSMFNFEVGKKQFDTPLETYTKLMKSFVGNNDNLNEIEGDNYATQLLRKLEEVYNIYKTSNYNAYAHELMSIHNVSNEYKLLFVLIKKNITVKDITKLKGKVYTNFQEYISGTDDTKLAKGIENVRKDLSSIFHYECSFEIASKFIQRGWVKDFYNPKLLKNSVSYATLYVKGAKQEIDSSALKTYIDKHNVKKENIDRIISRKVVDDLLKISKAKSQ